MLAAAWLAQRARALPLAARQPPPADEAQVAPHAADDAVRLTRFADLGVVVAAGGKSTLPGPRDGSLPPRRPPLTRHAPPPQSLAA